MLIAGSSAVPKFFIIKIFNFDMQHNEIFYNVSRNGPRYPSTKLKVIGL